MSEEQGWALDELARSLVDREGPGLFISFEGGDGCGKSTQVKRLAEELQARGVDVLSTREPGGTPLGQKLREHIQHGPADVDPRTEALLYAADRAYHAATLLRPAIAAGTTVLEDRYTDSSVAYQGAARDLGPEEIRRLSDWATQNLQPDITLLFDVDSEEGLRRVHSMGEGLDRLESAGLSFHQRVREEYLHIAKQFPERIVVLDAGQSIPQVFEDVVQALLTRVKQ
ncbi:dTMP kinase [Actinomyces minihominis]|uniref:dTMP kinase n=1 Tax=Actinomyces minihominis TaxID=2002838 RepID=UPI000C0706CE|nr:dTMP kinase [Actinomyces minihominis]